VTFTVVGIKREKDVLVVEMDGRNSDIDRLSSVYLRVPWAERDNYPIGELFSLISAQQLENHL